MNTSTTWVEHVNTTKKGHEIKHTAFFAARQKSTMHFSHIRLIMTAVNVNTFSVMCSFCLFTSEVVEWITCGWNSNLFCYQPKQFYFLGKEPQPRYERSHFTPQLREENVCHQKHSHEDVTYLLPIVCLTHVDYCTMK